ncbi:MAG TPA: M28 family peptidase [Bryobacteraceae bacterium]|nr:M28 family peptidase [Bryobacteraceae bacterium]
MKPILFLFAAAAVCTAQIQSISGERIRADVKFLASDLLEGRGVSGRGGKLATEYLAAQFAIAGAQPAGDNGTYFQKVPLVGVATQPDAQLTATRGGRTVSLKWQDEFVGADQRQEAAGTFDAEAIFVGHGIVAPEFQWDDFKGVDVRGKVLVLFTNEPDSTDPKFFGGRALTYYGRWTYKYEEALRKGAAAVLILHTTPTAGYGWNVVRSSWGREQFQVRLNPGEPALALAGWTTEAAGRRILELAGQDFAKLLAASNSRDFRPIPLGIRIAGRLRSKLEDTDTRNVVAKIPGSDPALKSEAVVFSGHWDHLGIGSPVNGDAIYNGAVDNATGCAMVLEIARAWAALEQKPRRTALFLIPTAEESGLLGSEYYAAHPVFPAAKTAVDINLDGFFPLGRWLDVVVNGADRTTLWPLVEEAARRSKFTIAPDPEPEQGSYYRSDHFPFAHAGVPAFSISQGADIAGQPAGAGTRASRDYEEKHYHQPSDEYRPEWNFSGLEDLARFAMLLGVNTANLDQVPTWNQGDEFLPARQQSGVK